MEQLALPFFSKRRSISSSVLPVVSGHMNQTKGMATAQEARHQIHNFQPTLFSPIPPANTVMKQKSHSPNAPAAAPTWRNWSGAILRIISSEHGISRDKYCGDTYLGSIQPANADPPIPENQVVDNDSCNSCPLLCQCGMWRSNHADEKHEADCKPTSGVYHYLSPSKSFNCSWKKDRSDSENGVHDSGKELGDI